MSDSSLTCKYCFKKYSRASFYQRHMLTCERKNITNNDSYKKIFTLSEVTEIIGEMMEKINKLERENEEFRKYVVKQKKKCNILDWLQENKICTIHFDAFLEKITLTERDLMSVFESNSSSDGITNLILKYFPIENRSEFPIVSFSQNKNCFYIFKNDKWYLMKEKECKSFINKFTSQLLKLFKVWFDNNKKNLFRNEDSHEEYFKNLEKIIGKSNQMTENHRKIKQNIYEYLKYDLKQITEYQFIF